MAKIIFIQTAFLGDCILSTGLIEKWNAYYPNDQIDVLIRKGNEGVFENNPHVHRIFIWDKKKSKYKQLFNLIGHLRKAKYDMLFNLQRFASTGLLTACSGARIKTGFDKNPLSFLFDRRIIHQIGGPSKIHEVERNHLLIKEFTDSEAGLPRIYASNEHSLVSQIGEYGTYITIAPASVWFTKQYPFQKWVSFLTKIDPKYTVVLLGSKQDHQLCEQIKFAAKEVHAKLQISNLCGTLNIVESARVMKQAVMNYVNDSAPMHIASAVNAAVCAIYCSTIPDFGFGPLSEHSFIVQYKGSLDCRPCGLHGKKACPEHHFKCAGMIEDQQLLDVLRAVAG